MAKEKKQQIKMVTPEGVTKFPWLTEPDTRFNEAGEYSVSLILPEDDEETQKLMAKIQKLFEDFRATLPPAKKKKEAESLGFTKDYDEEGEETGYVIFKFKAKTGYNDPKSNDWKKLPPPALFDCNLNPLSSDTSIWGGSTAIVNFSPVAYDHGKNLGVTLRLNAVQIINLRNGSAGAKDAGSYGFSKADGVAPSNEMEANDEEYEDMDSPASDEDDF